LLLGDNCIDVYRYGTVDRISPEAPVPVFKFAHQDTKPGMAGNVRENLLSLGCEVREYLSEPSTKTRIIDIRSRQHILRIDDDLANQALDFDSIAVSDLTWAQAIVISDYAKGFIDGRLLRDLRRVYQGPIFIDTKQPDLGRLTGFIVKINEAEHRARSSTAEVMIVTLGARGAMLLEARQPERTFPAPQVEVSDVCGAGDTFLAALTREYLMAGDLARATAFAVRAAAVTVQHLGVYAPRLEEIQ
jgi:D-beta-D-heptose 7-phosphate kinase/D-beta-D-heptose 1-phosphate adenosyltransferase